MNKLKQNKPNNKIPNISLSILLLLLSSGYASAGYSHLSAGQETPRNQEKILTPQIAQNYYNVKPKKTKKQEESNAEEKDENKKKKKKQ